MTLNEREKELELFNSWADSEGLDIKMSSETEHSSKETHLAFLAWLGAKAQAVPEVPVLTFGYGDIDVMEGIYQGSYSLMLGKNGGGIVGGDNQANRIAEDDELYVVFKFHNEKSIRVVIDRLLRLHKRLCNKEPVEIKDANGEVIKTIYASESGAEG